jgi:glycolate dehydrogenase FAD-linked subunit
MKFNTSGSSMSISSEIAPEFKHRLLAIVGEENFSDQSIDLVSGSYDASRHRGRPWAVVWPRDSESVAGILALAQQERIPLVPRGAGTSLTGMAVPARGGLVLDMCRMNRILEISIKDRVAVVEPGVVYEDLQKALSTQGFFFPPDPASGKVCTIGGNVAANAGGLHGAKYGSTREYVLGLEVVIPGGKSMSIGTRTMKCSSGYDLVHLFVGSEGTLGVVCQVTLKIDPKPTAFATTLAAFPSLEAAGRAVSEIMSCGVIPSVCEFFDSNTVKVLRQHGGLSLPHSEALLLVETDGIRQEEADLHMSVIMDVLSTCKTTQVRKARDRDEAQEFWRHRKNLGGLKNLLASGWASEDVTVPIGSIAQLVSGIDRIVKSKGLGLMMFGHAGDGNFHPVILYDRQTSSHEVLVHEAVQEIFRLGLELGGTLSGEHGIGMEKAPFMAWEHDEPSLAAMRGIKALFDPHNIMNPGKMAMG